MHNGCKERRLNNIEIYYMGYLAFNTIESKPIWRTEGKQRASKQLSLVNRKSNFLSLKEPNVTSIYQWYKGLEASDWNTSHKKEDKPFMEIGILESGTSYLLSKGCSFHGYKP